MTAAVLRDTGGRFAAPPVVTAHTSAATADVEMRRRFNTGIRQTVTHMLNHPPTESRTRRVSELLIASVEAQVRLVPGGRALLPLPRSWEPSS